MIKVLHVVGARPQFVKAAPVSRALRSEGLEEVLVHTGQHYDWEMSAAFFEGLDLPAPAYDLGIGSAGHGAQTGRMLESLETVAESEEPDAVLVHGDTNSTLAGALVAAKLHIPVAHVEAGLRSFNRRMPEEINRVVTDHLSTLLFAPTDRAVENLTAEGITEGVVRTGDVMYDLALEMSEAIEAASSETLRRFDVSRGEYVLVTIHRPENTDSQERWQVILNGLTGIARESLPVVWLIHPRAKQLVAGFSTPGVGVFGPQPYLVTQILVRHARVVMTDSGGLQKEAAFHETPCVTFRDQTEWVELIKAGVNVLCPPKADELVSRVLTAKWPAGGFAGQPYGNGTTSVTIARCLQEHFGSRQ